MSTRADIPQPPPSLIAARRRALLAWYDRTARDLPWRRRPTLYGTWIAEMMLQQTTVATVSSRWEGFLARFPDVAALAAADEGHVLAAWSGLGYYRRARHLHAAARLLAATCGGVLPTTLAGWRALPGVGDYAAGAIASIGLGLSAPAVDANVRRVLTRWTCADAAQAAGLSSRILHDLAARHVPADRPGDWNQAVMDLGAGPCRSGRPDCVACPVRSWCAADRAGTAAELPPRTDRSASVPVTLSVLVLRCAGDVLFLRSAASVVARLEGLGRPVRSDMTGLFAGLLALPSTPWYARDPALQERERGAMTGIVEAAWRGTLRRFGWRKPAVTVTASYRHAITVYRLQVVVAAAEWPDSLPRPDLAAGVWTRPGAAELPLATLARRAVESGTNDL